MEQEKRERRTDSRGEGRKIDHEGGEEIGIGRKRGIKRKREEK